MLFSQGDTSPISFFCSMKTANESGSQETAQVQQLQSPSSTVFNIVKAIVGAGIFGTSYALNKSGFVFGLVLLVLLAFVFRHTIMTMVRASDISQQSSAQDLMKVLCI